MFDDPSQQDPTLCEGLPCPVLRLGPDFALLDANTAARQQVPVLCKKGAVRRLLRARPDLTKPLRDGQTVSVSLFQLAPNQLTLSLLPTPAGGYLGLLTPTPAEQTFSAGFAAQLRDPLTEAFALLPLLANQMDPASDYCALDRLNLCCYRMLRATRLLSQLSVLASLSPTDVVSDFDAVTRGVCVAVQNVLLPGQPPLKYDLSGTKLPVAAGPDTLSTMVTALLENALRFSRDGNLIQLSLQAVQGHALLRVTDSGCGIRPEILPHIFDPFFSADCYGDGAPAPGAGLGLTFVRALASKLGGTVSAESRFGEGTQIAVSLPLVAEYTGRAQGSNAVDYLTNRYSVVFVQLCEFCRLPDIG